MTQEDGGPISRVCKGDTVYVQANVKHWHGALPTEGLTQVSLSFGVTNWMEKVTDAQYSGKAK